MQHFMDRLRNCIGWLALRGLCVARFLGLNVYPVLVALAGVALILVPQISEIVFSLFGVAHDDPGGGQAFKTAQRVFAVLAFLSWAASVWYSMRILSSTRYPGDPEPAAEVASFMHALNADAPRLLALLGAVLVAQIGALHIAGAAAVSLFQAIANAVFLVLARECVFALADGWFRFRATAGEAFGDRYRIHVSLIAAASLLVVAYVLYGMIPPKDGGLLKLLGCSTNPAGRILCPGLPTMLPPIPAVLQVLTLAILLAASRGSGRLRSGLLVTATLVWTTSVLMAPVTAVVAWGGPLILLVIAGFWWISSRRQLERLGMRVTDAGAPATHVEKATQWAVRVTITLLLFFAGLFSVAPIRMGEWLGTFAIAYLALALWCFFGSFVFVFLPKRRGWGSWALLPLVWVFLLGRPANHDLKSTTFPPASGIPAVTLPVHFSAWAKQLPEPEGSPVFVVAAAGGGLRAAYWTAMLLAAADERSCGEFGRHVYAYSGVSGGSLGIAVYLGQRAIWQQKPPEERCKPGRLDELRSVLQRDFLAPAAGSMLFAEGFQALVPFTYLVNDRGSTLAASWDAAWAAVYRGQPGENWFRRSFHDLFRTQGLPVAAPVPPVLIFNATSVKSGRRVVATNVDVSLPSSDNLFWSEPVSRGVQLKSFGLPLSETVLNSARFTFVSPAGNVYSCQSAGAGSGRCDVGSEALWGRLVDGGYFENTGLESATDLRDLLVEQVASEHTGRRIHVIAINNGEKVRNHCPGMTPRYDLRDEQVMKTLKHLNRLIVGRTQAISEPERHIPMFSELSSPLEALLSVREGRSNLEVERVALEVGCARLLEWNLTTALRPQASPAREPPLGWFLSARSVATMDMAVQAYAGAFPFDLPKCAGQYTRSRGFIGSAELVPPSCPPVKAVKPLVPGVR